jgi:hypothetical protein
MLIPEAFVHPPARRTLMLHEYFVDSFEDGGWAVLLTDAGRPFSVPRGWLPPATREGDVLAAEALPTGTPADARLRLTVDPSARARREARAAAVRDRIARTDEGDLAL